MSRTYPVSIPSDLFTEATETREDQFWTDDRGFTFAIAWSDEHQQPMAACVAVPDGDTPANAWHRDTPQPEVIEH